MNDGLLLEKTVYYRVQRECLAATEGADSIDRAVYLEAARLAEALAHALEDDAIEASLRVLWARYAAELESVIRLAGTDMSADEVQRRLSAGAAIICPPKSGL